MKKNEKGFGAVEIVLLFVVVGLICGVGVYLYNTNKSSAPVTSETANNTETNNKSDTSPSLTSDSIDIKEWNVKFKLTDDAKGSYYKFRAEQDNYNYVDIYNANFDIFKNSDGDECNEEILFVIARYSENDTRLEDLSNPKPELFIDNYGYTGTEAHQSPPGCAFIGDAGDMDSKVLDNFTKYKKALTESFKSIKKSE